MTRRNNTDLKDVWQTPPELLDLLRTPTTPIDLDPCAGQDTDIGTVNYCGERMNGLLARWFGRVFVNPPFSDKEQWLEKAIEEVEAGNADVIFVLTPDSTDVKSWWHGYIAPEADYVWFSEGRISYIDPDSGQQMGSPTFGTAISIYGEPEDFVLHNLSCHGHLLETVDR